MSMSKSSYTYNRKTWEDAVSFYAISNIIFSEEFKWIVVPPLSTVLFLVEEMR